VGLFLPEIVYDDTEWSGKIKVKEWDGLEKLGER
jgi:hypothetical protein